MDHVCRKHSSCDCGSRCDLCESHDDPCTSKTIRPPSVDTELTIMQEVAREDGYVPRYLRGKAIRPLYIDQED